MILRCVVKSIVHRTILRFLSVCFLLVGINTYADDVLTVGWEHYPPQQWIDGDGVLRGVDIEVVKAVINRAGFEVDFKEMPWKRLVNISLKNGDIDVALSVAKSSSRSYLYYSSIPYLLPDSALFIRAEDTDKFTNIQALPDLIGSQFTMGVIVDFLYSEEYERLRLLPEFNQHLHVAANEEQLFKMLMAGRVDGVLFERYRMNKFLEQWQATKSIVAHSEMGINTAESGNFLGYSKKSVSEQQAQKLNQALEDLKRDGTLDKIIATFLLTHGR